MNMLFLSGNTNKTCTCILDIKLDFASLLVREVRKSCILSVFDGLCAIKKKNKQT